MEQSFIMSAKQGQNLTGRQLAQLDILAMSARDLELLIDKEYEDNPLLERCGDKNHRNAPLSYDCEALLCIPAPQETTPLEIVLSQLSPHKLTDTAEHTHRIIASHIDDNGYLSASVEEISSFSGINTRQLEHCLAVVHQMEPPGIGARTLEECLSLQLDRLNDSDPLDYEIVRNHLHNVAAGKLTIIANRLGKGVSEVRSRIEIIKKLNPKPLNGIVGEPSKAVVPDIIITRRDGIWHVELNDSWGAGLRICDYYLKLAAGTENAELKSYLKAKAGRVHFLNNAIKRRRSTLLRIGEHLAEVQSDFFLRGGAPNTLTMSQTANALGIHSSTVSRAVRDKYVQYPGCVSKIRALFARSTAPLSKSKGTASREEVKMQIRELVRNEDKSSPLSDEQIRSFIKHTGETVSRRTVAKYRSELRIRGMHARRVTL